MKINIKIYLFFSEGRKSKEIKGNQRKSKERKGKGILWWWKFCKYNRL